jgi:hypothetical protein
MIHGGNLKLMKGLIKLFENEAKLRVLELY